METAPLKPPSGLNEIVATFGDFSAYVKSLPGDVRVLDPAFERLFISCARLPLPLRLAWNPEKSITSFHCHILLKEKFEAIFDDIYGRGYYGKISSFGGCFVFRKKRSGTGYSTHSWGIAIDLNPDSNRRGTMGTMDRDIVGLFKEYGFFWGGEWRGAKKDPMHFQYCTGY